MENNVIINGNCWIAYFDILGFGKMVQNFPVEFVLKQLQEARKESRRHNVNCKFIFFSDSFIFYTEDDSQESFYGISAALELFFQDMFLKEIPMRGCLNIGRFYADEENGIFFGRALIDAYNSCEGQNWIGFVLSEKAREKSQRFKSNKDFWYLEYEVPYKIKPKHRKLLVYYPNILITQSFPGPADYEQTRLLGALDTMQYKARLIYQKEKSDNGFCLKKYLEFRATTTKYKNTRRFLEQVYPVLRKRFKSKYPIPKRPAFS